MANRRFTQFFNTLHNKPALLDCNFIVDSTNVNGLGVSSLKGPGIKQVYMHTSATPLLGNPNPAVGYAVIALEDNYNGLFMGLNGMAVPPVTGSGLTSGLTVGVPYQIATLGSSSLAQWQTAGLPVGIVPAVDVVFIAAATTVAGGGTVKAIATSGISAVEVLGNPNLTLKANSRNVPGISSLGSYMVVQFLKQTVTMGAYTPAGTISAPVLTMNSYTPTGVNDGGSPPIFTGDAAVLTGSVSAPTFTGSAASLTGTSALSVAAPVDGSKVSLGIYLSNSSIIVSGE